MINEKEMRQLDLKAGHTPVKKATSQKGENSTRLTGSLFRECITTLTRA